MKFLEKFSINICKTTGSRLLQITDAGSLSRILSRGVSLLDDSIKAEMREWILSQQTSSGGFPDRGGEPDLYYTLFGFYLAGALEADMVLPMLKDYVKREARQQHHQGIDLFCLAILHASLFPDDPATIRYAQEIRKIRSDSILQQNGYFPFLAILSLLYLRDHAGAWRILRSIGNGRNRSDKPCPVVAAEQVLAFMKAGVAGEKPLMAFYRGNGGFAALSNAPVPDLLSTAVALFALQFAGNDLRLVRPDCLRYVEELYHEGGFRAGIRDEDVDVEYTFYGLLALGALKSNSKIKDQKSKLEERN
jgi:hypothetical protein